MKNWQVYYMDNDGRKQIIQTGLSYERAVKLWQQTNDKGINFAHYEAIKRTPTGGH